MSEQEETKGEELCYAPIILFLSALDEVTMEMAEKIGANDHLLLSDVFKEITHLMCVFQGIVSGEDGDLRVRMLCHLMYVTGKCPSDMFELKQ